MRKRKSPLRTVATWIVYAAILWGAMHIPNGTFLESRIFGGAFCMVWGILAWCMGSVTVNNRDVGLAPARILGGVVFVIGATLVVTGWLAAKSV